MKKFISYLTVAFTLATPAVFATDDGAPSEVPVDSTIWVYKSSHIKDCEDANADFSDLEEGKAVLTAQKIPVLASERNLHPSAKAPGRRCNETGGYVACYLVFGEDKKAVMNLGFKIGGLCGKNQANRTH